MMNLNEVKLMSFAEWAAAVGLLTPLILGILAFLEKFINRKKEPEKKEEEVVQGLAVSTNSYADDLISELRRELKETKEELRIAQAINNERKNNG